MNPRWSIYHADNPNYSPLLNTINGLTKSISFPQDYTKIAEVACEDLEEVFRITNDIDSDWTKGPSVIWHKDRCRSTSVGDIVIDENLGIWYCDSVGWKQLDK